MIKPYQHRDNLFLQLTGFVFFTCLFVFALVFYKERMLTFDSSFFAFCMIDSRGFDVVLGRWGQAIPQLLPVWLLKQGCSLQTFLQCFSVSFILIYYLIFLVITRVLKHVQGGWVLLFTLCLGFRDVFYYATAELHLGLVCTVLLWSLLMTYAPGMRMWKRLLYLLALAAVIVFISFCNPAGLFGVVFVILAALFIKQDGYKHMFYWLFLVFTLVWYYVNMNYLNVSDYDQRKLMNATLFADKFTSLFSLPSTRYFIAHAVKHLWWCALLGILGVVLARINGKHLFSYFAIAYTLFFLVVIFIIYHNGEAPIMYQNYYILLGLFASITLFSFFEPKSFLRLKYILVVVLFFNLVSVYNSHHFFSNRLYFIDRLVSHARQTPYRKFVVPSNLFPWQLTWIKWAFPFETALYSALQDKEDALSFYIMEKDQYKDELLQHNGETTFFGPDWSPLWFTTDNLNADYLSIKKGNYLVIPFKD